jgi:hypothetical protein
MTNVCLGTTLSGKHDRDPPERVEWGRTIIDAQPPPAGTCRSGGPSVNITPQTLPSDVYQALRAGVTHADITPLYISAHVASLQA